MRHHHHAVGKAVAEYMLRQWQMHPNTPVKFSKLVKEMHVKIGWPENAHNKLKRLLAAMVNDGVLEPPLEKPVRYKLSERTAALKRIPEHFPFPKENPFKNQHFKFDSRNTPKDSPDWINGKLDTLDVKPDLTEYKVPILSEDFDADDPDVVADVEFGKKLQKGEIVEEPAIEESPAPAVVEEVAITEQTDAIVNTEILRSILEDVDDAAGEVRTVSNQLEGLKRTVFRLLDKLVSCSRRLNTEINKLTK